CASSSGCATRADRSRSRRRPDDVTMSHTRRPANEIPLRGGHVALDFVNTAGWHASDAPTEWLADYDELARWGAHAGLLTDAESAALHDGAAADPEAAERVRRQAVALREALFRV